MNLDLALSRLKSMSSHDLEAAIRSAMEESGIPVDPTPCAFHFVSLSMSDCEEVTHALAVEHLCSSTQNYPYQQHADMLWIAA